MEAFIVLLLIGFCIYVLRDTYKDLKNKLDEHNEKESK